MEGLSYITTISQLWYSKDNATTVNMYIVSKLLKRLKCEEERKGLEL